jgi:hypothetical protein
MDTTHQKRLHVDDLIIDNDWRVGQVATVDDCDRAMVSLKMGMDSIKSQLETDKDRDDAWYRRARSALTLKQAAYMALQNKRRDLSKEQRAASNRENVVEKYARKFIIEHHGAEQWMLLLETASEELRGDIGGKPSHSAPV